MERGEAQRAIQVSAEMHDVSMVWVLRDKDEAMLGNQE
jgi:hypothetical protein